MTVAAGGSEVYGTTGANGVVTLQEGPQSTTITINLENFAVVKRNGTLVPFRRARIVRAIELALRATNNISAEQQLPLELSQQVQTVTDKVIKAIAVKVPRAADRVASGSVRTHV